MRTCFTSGKKQKSALRSGKRPREKSESSTNGQYQMCERSFINNDSNNSSKPPSSDQKPNKRANEYNGRKSSGKKRGGQTGHKGRALSKEDAEELIRSGKVKHEVIDVNRGKGRAKYIDGATYSGKIR